MIDNNSDRRTIDIVKIRYDMIYLSLKDSFHINIAIVEIIDYRDYCICMLTIRRNFYFPMV